MSDLSKLTNAEFKARLLSAAAIADTMMAGGGFLLREAASRLQAPAVAEVEREQEIVAAYKRGAAWWLDNGTSSPDSDDWLEKAAYDYADKTMGPPAALRTGGSE